MKNRNEKERKRFSTITNMIASHSDGHVCAGSRTTIGQHRALRHRPRQGIGRGLKMGLSLSD